MPRIPVESESRVASKRAAAIRLRSRGDPGSLGEIRRTSSEEPPTTPSEETTLRPFLSPKATHAVHRRLLCASATNSTARANNPFEF